MKNISSDIPKGRMITKFNNKQDLENYKTYVVFGFIDYNGFTGISDISFS